MPPVNTPLLASPNMQRRSPPPLSPSSPSIPRASAHAAPTGPREPTPPPLAYLSSPVADLAATLSTSAAQEADEANVRFLRESLSSLEQTGASTMRGTHVDVARDPRAQPQQPQASGSGETPEDLSRRERLQRVLARLNRLHDPPPAPGMSSSGAYSNRTPPPDERQSIYDWAPGGAEYHEADRDRRDGELDAILRELREQRQEDSARRHQRQANGTPAPGGSGAGEDNGAASERRDRLRERERRRRETEWVSLRTRAAIQRSRGSNASANGSDGAATPVSPSSVSTERMLRYVMERERSGMSEEEERARGAGWFRPTPRSAQDSAADRSTNTNIDGPMSDTAANRSERDGWMLPPPASTSNGHASAETRERQGRVESERQERVEAFRRGYLAENVPPRLPRISTPTVPLSVAAPMTTSASSTAFLETALKYLSELRGCLQYEEALSTAIDHGLATKEFFADKHDDFIMDLEALDPLADSSWMQPGTVFDGHQHATNTSCPIYTRSGAARTHERAGNTTHVVEQINPNYTRPTWAPTASDGPDHPPGSTILNYTRPDWAETAGPVFDHPPGSTRTYPSASYTSVNKHLPDPQHDHWPVRVILHAIDTEAMTVQGTMEAYDVPQHPANLNILNPGAERPKAGRRDAPITTYLEGHIIDLKTHSFLTPAPPISRKGRSSEQSQSRSDPDLIFPSAIPQTDAQNWLKLPPFNTLTSGSSQSLPDECARLLLSQARMSELFQEYIFMRWKERCFVHSRHDRCSSDERHGDQDRGHGLTISGFYYVSLRRCDGVVEGLYFDPASTPYQHLRLKGVVGGWPAYGFR
ncbi:Vacuolar import and degradation protein [Teratosphaeria destructans]|uniref:Vacuolar import and degradation protein n=1 Tax=Teratosphaeria destructans TaxID=418781 RepID=A0A9W7W2A1_9PEZI|nr:Vacuolar import and degradation protein [Teratosphaeria destructans]